jgi:predicted acylesterase/phospholipase RssA
VEFRKHFYRHRGITVIQKRDPSRARFRRSKVAVVLAGGAISGGAFKAGGLRALEEMFAGRRTPGGASVPFSLTDADIFVGLSAGSVLATVLAAGIAPAEVLRIVLGQSKIYEQFTQREFMALNPFPMAARAVAMLRHQERLFTNFLSGATDPATVAPFTLQKTLLKMFGSVMRGLPMGLFTTDRLGAYLRRNAARAGVSDDFATEYARTGKELMLTAVDVNRGELIVFGHDEPYGQVPISEAVRASCALPGWYAPVRLKNPRAGEPLEPPFLDLVDGALMRTANVRVAVEKGADLVICYNPFTRIRYQREGRSLVDHGPAAFAGQLFRILLGARLDLAKELLFRDETIDADVVFIEPAEDDFDFFRMNPLRHSQQERAAAHGYRAISAGIAANHEKLVEIFATHGIQLHEPASSVAGAWAGTELGEADLSESRAVRGARSLAPIS